MKYYISGDRTGVTYGIFAEEDDAPPFSGKMIEGGLKSHNAASRRIDELKKEDAKKK